MPTEHYRKEPWADERNGQPILTNCVAASGVNIGRAATNGAIPATDAEVIALRNATGDTQGGENLDQLHHGMLARYDIRGKRTRGLWAPIETGLKTGNMWWVVIGQLHSLPKRLWTQPHDVTHAILFGPASDVQLVEVDPLMAHPVPKLLTFDEAKAFCRSGYYEAYGLEEYSETPHVAVRASLLRPVRLYTKKGNKWVGRWSISARFTARVSKAEYFTVSGKRRRMVKVTSGSHATRVPALWLNADGTGVVYTEGE